MSKKGLPDRAFSLIAIAICLAIALFVRIALPYPSIFSPEGIRLTGIDSYFYMRLVDNLVHNFPNVIQFDPYLIYPGGDHVSRVPTFHALLLAGVVRILGGAAPDQQVIDSIAVYLPPVLGALSTIALFFIGRALINKWAGLAAALAIALTPGELMARSLLGYTDHHIAEVFFTAFFCLFFILAIKNGGRPQGDTPPPRALSLPLSKYVPYSLAAGFFLGLYLITWQGALFFILIIYVFFVLQFISDYLHGYRSDYLSKIAIVTFLFALLVCLPIVHDKLTLLAVAGLVLLPILLNFIATAMRAAGARPAWFLAVLAGLGGLGALVVWLVAPSLFKTIINYLLAFFTWNPGAVVVGEMKPLFFPGGFFSFQQAWSEYGLMLYLGAAGLALLIFDAIRGGRPEHIFTSAWGLVMLLAALAMVRFTYYFGVCAALLTGYLLGRAISLIVPAPKVIEEQKMSKKARKRKARSAGISTSRVSWLALTVLALAGMLVPGAVNAIDTAGHPGHMPTPAWLEAMNWLQKNSPEPFGGDDFYYAYYKAPAAGKGYEYPATAYSVMTWSDYGYWIVRMAHRPPVANPGSTHFDEARFYTAQDEATAGDIMKTLGARYVVIDNRIVSPNDKFYAVANKSNREESDYYELCWQMKEGRYEPLLVFYPEYYRTMLSRLYNFDCAAVVPEVTTVMTWEERSLPDGQKFKAITELKTFPTYEQAESFVASRKAGCNIVGTDPLKSPVPLEELKGYRTVYRSSQKASAGSTPLPEVKIFEYTGAGQ